MTKASRGFPGTAVDDEILGPLGDVGIEVVHQHPQRGFLLPSLARQDSSAGCSDRLGHGRGYYHFPAPPARAARLPVWHDRHHIGVSRCPWSTTNRELGRRPRVVRGLLCCPGMHLALRRYADPPRGIVPLFCIGALAGVLVLSIIADRIAAFERDEAANARPAGEAVVSGTDDDLRSDR